jgi:iron(II)-dependent oxidoreductase
MSDEGNVIEPNVQATDNSTAVGKIEVGGSVGGNINIGGTHIINNYVTPGPVKSPDLDEIIKTQYFEPETILIPAGMFWMGANAATGISNHETPLHEVYLLEYRIGKYPVTTAQYEEFIRESNRSVAPEMGWDGQKVTAGTEKLPVVGVTWYDAKAYCEWLSKKTARKYSLPNEAQWEKACRAGGQSMYPWGDVFDQSLSNHGQPRLANVDAFPAQSGYGCFDFVGNVRQWTISLWGEKRITPDPKYAYPWKDDERNDMNASRQVRRVVRGSTPRDDVSLLRCSARNGQAPDDVGLPGARHGFRVVMSV